MIEFSLSPPKNVCRDQRDDGAEEALLNLSLTLRSHVGTGSLTRTFMDRSSSPSPCRGIIANSAVAVTSCI